MSLRIDRMASLYVFAPLRKLSLHRKTGVPILMYHSVSQEREDRLHPYYRTVTSPEMFAAQMRFLAEAGYRAVSLDDLQRGWENKTPGRRQVVITFDDGFQDFADEAFPILQKYGFSATVFLPTGYLGKEFAPLKNKRCLSWDGVRELHKSGIRFGSHTVTHPKLRFLGKQEIERELGDSKKMIEDALGEPAASFSYPYAFPEENKELTAYLKGVLLECGYKNGVSTRIGTALDEGEAFFLKRLPVNSDDDIPFFRAKLEGGYDWLHALQISSKVIKEKLRGAKRSG